MHYLLIGYGIVGRNLLDHLDGPVTVIDHQVVHPVHPRIQQVIQEKVTEENFERLLHVLTQVGDIIIETAVEIDTAIIGLWAHTNGRHYINTVCDMWLPKTLELTDNYRNINNLLYQYTQQPLALATSIRSGPTCLLGHGANIGMVNHFFKMAVLEKATRNGMDPTTLLSAVKQVYILEKDTLLFKAGFIPDPHKFYNTWNILEFIMESTALADYPTHGQIRRSEQAEIRDVFLGDVCIHGRVVSHEETYTINHYLTQQGACPEKIQFIYECSPVGEQSRIKFPFGSVYTSQAATSELNATAGFDLVGALVVFEDGFNWFYGYRMTQASIESVHTTNATAWFVTAGVLTGIQLIKANPDLGFNFPENLDFTLNQQAVNCFLTYASPGNLLSRSIDHLYLSDEYETYEVANLYTARQRTEAPPIVEAIDLTATNKHW